MTDETMTDVRRRRLAADAILLLLLTLGFLGLLSHYGETLLPAIPDEMTFLQPAEGLATGRGMGTPILDGLLPGIDQRTYWQPPGYFLCLALWGKVVGFEPIRARWLSRLLGVIGLFLVWRLALMWGIPKGGAWFCVLGTALDLTYQYAANLARMDILNAVLVLVALVAFTIALERNDGRALGISGVAMAAAVLTHLIATPLTVWLAIVAGRRWGWRGVGVFLMPLAIGMALWAIYIAQDVDSFVSQLEAQINRKAKFVALDRPFLLVPFWVSILFTQGVFGVFPTNTPFSLPFIVLCLYAAWRYHPLSWWRVLSLALAYASASLGGEIWYVGWFAPFSYLAIALAGWEIAKVAPKGRAWLVGLGLLWTGFQTLQVAQAVAAIPTLRADTQRYFAELARRLLPKATVVVHSIPDPAFFLRRERPDLHLYELSPTPLSQEVLEQLRVQEPIYIGVPKWLEGQRVCGDGKLHPLGVWDFKVGARRYRLILGKCRP